MQHKAIFFVCLFLLLGVVVLDLTAPDSFQVKFQTTVQVGDGSFTVYVQRSWAPIGVDHFYTLLQPETYYYDGNGFFRVVPGFVVQWGINGNPNVTAEWDTPILDDPVIKSNLRGWMTYATAGPNTRTTQLYINYANNSYLDAQGFAPFAFVVSGMQVVDQIYSGYGQEPLQPLITKYGNEYLESHFPLLDYIQTARIVG